ncbi:glycoside hydrolase family 99-like domain-containing protein [Pseudoxanthomonas sp.]|uniref:glycoside hydrolase family 99-like domain-containing protein n=1 Tax=Pseudoxanthomonas sp. TaxID=1871049 RepID=UPI002FDF8A68
MPNPLSRRLRTTLFYALRTAFRLTPMPQGTRDRLRERFLDTKGHWVPEGPKGQAPTGELPRRPYVRSDERAIGYVPYEKGELPDPLPATLVAFYLPQFHTIPENDEWWGKGFTEWRNVTRALPQFEGHYQPKLPGDLGFYDLRNVEVMHEQARLAREYGISAFCFYFYWFGGKTLLETPLRNWLNDKTIDLQFCLCWANEKWTRTWDGRGDEILIDQKHSPEDDIAFIEHVAEYMRDPRYLRIDGKPVLLIYRPGSLPDAIATAGRWRRSCRENGVGEIHLAYVQSFERQPPASFGLDSAIQFPPNMSSAKPFGDGIHLVNPDYAGRIHDWRQLNRDFEESLSSSTGYRLFPGINTGWDNEPRRPGRGTTYACSAPFRYERWLRRSVEWATAQQDETPIFINAWNEWAEGALLEPEARSGYAHLSSTRLALSKQGPLPIRPIVVLHAWHLDVLEEILDQLHKCKVPWQLEVSTTPEKAQAAVDILRQCDLQHRLHVISNRGRDILPFLEITSLLVREREQLILKLHTKRSPHRSDGDEWRRELVSNLVSGFRAQKILDAFSQDPKMGLVAPEGHVQPMNYYWGANAPAVLQLASRLGLSLTGVSESEFVSGSMFWVRLQAIRPLLEIGLTRSDFEQEKSQVDGTMAHAIERLIAPCVASEGWKWTTAAHIMGQSMPGRMSSYRYAKRNGEQRS